MAASALIVKVPEAELVVAPLRARYDATSQLGVPAHVTILFPFMEPSYVTPAVLQRLQTALNSVPAFSYSLTSVGRFDASTYLAPSPPEPFILLTEIVTRAFPEFPPYGGLHSGTVPHLTVAHGDTSNAAVAAIDLEFRLRAYAEIQARCNSVVMLENVSGFWQEMHVFELQE